MISLCYWQNNMSTLACNSYVLACSIHTTVLTSAYLHTQVASDVPERLWVEVAGVHTVRRGINPWQLPLVKTHKVGWLLLHQLVSLGFTKRWYQPTAAPWHQKTRAWTSIRCLCICILQYWIWHMPKTMYPKSVMCSCMVYLVSQDPA